MAIFASAGMDVGGANDADTTYVAGHSYSVQHCHDQFATTGDTITLPNGTFTWSTGVSMTKAVILQSANFQQATINPGNIGANSHALSVKKSTGIAFTSVNGAHASIRVTGINFTATTATQVFKHIGITELAGADSVSGTGTYLISTNPVLIDNCVFTCGSTLTGTTQCGAIDLLANGAVIAWNTFYNTNTGTGSGAGSLGFDTGGIECHNPGGGALHPSWQSFDSMGTNDTNGTLNIYVENNTFNGLLNQALDHGDNSRVVWRDNTMNDSAITSHGQDSGPSGGRHIEVYDNTFVFHTSGAIPYSPGNNYPISLGYWYIHRAATGIFTGNTIPDMSSTAWGNPASVVYGVFNINTGPNLVPCQTSYPAARQVGQTWIGAAVSGFPPHRFNGDLGQSGSTTSFDGPTDAQFAAGIGYVTDPFYIFSNTPPTGRWATFSVEDQTATVGSRCASFCTWINGHGGSACTGSYSPSYASQFITSGTDVVYAPKTSGPTAAWTKYTFPHPLNPGQPGGNITVSLSGNISLTGVVNPGINASGLTATAEARIVRTIVGATGGYIIPSNNWVALFSTQFSSAKAGATEWTDGSYVRQAMGASATGWTIAAYANGVGTVWKNANLVTFPIPTVSQTLFSVGFCDALTSGNVDFFVDLLSTVTVIPGINVTLPASTGAVFTTY